MPEIVWKDSYSVGVPSLDDQHKILIRTINELHEFGRGGIDLRDILDRLDDYVREHFTLEESMMRDARYNQLDSHIAEHRDFEHWLRAARSHMATGGSGVGEMVRAITDHLDEWLTRHILIVDMDYKAILSPTKH